MRLRNVVFISDLYPHVRVPISLLEKQCPEEMERICNPNSYVGVFTYHHYYKLIQACKDYIVDNSQLVRFLTYDDPDDDVIIDNFFQICIKDSKPTSIDFYCAGVTKKHRYTGDIRFVFWDD